MRSAFFFFFFFLLFFFFFFFFFLAFWGWGRAGHTGMGHHVAEAREFILRAWVGRDFPGVAIL